MAWLPASRFTEMTLGEVSCQLFEIERGTQWVCVVHISGYICHLIYFPSFISLLVALMLPIPCHKGKGILSLQILFLRCQQMVILGTILLLLHMNLNPSHCSTHSMTMFVSTLPSGRLLQR